MSCSGNIDRGSHKHTYSAYTDKNICVWKKKQPLPLQLLRRYRWFWPGSKRKAYSFSKEVTASMCTRKIWGFSNSVNCRRVRNSENRWKGNRQLMVLSIPPGGYTVLYLKATTASAKGYKRPLQKDQVSTHLHQNRSKCRWMFFFLLPNSAMISIPFAGPRVLNKLWWSLLKTTNSCLYQWKSIIKMNEWINKINKPMNKRRN